MHFNVVPIHSRNLILLRSCLCSCLSIKFSSPRSSLVLQHSQFEDLKKPTTDSSQKHTSTAVGLKPISEVGPLCLSSLCPTTSFNFSSSKMASKKVQVVSTNKNTIKNIAAALGNNNTSIGHVTRRKAKVTTVFVNHEVASNSNVTKVLLDKSKTVGTSTSQEVKKEDGTKLHSV
ncbi:hypothetical protein Acr_00g0092280 [Actinidia rufa]|uniref:Uncharacterized protein n=1 Tax=Actinidia rufa TaxID=165716 RepID=A0A7J0DXF1_9ERIC|nr:hypothetical protein Acr_00g0092280 [Actinidia rufa]